MCSWVAEGEAAELFKFLGSVGVLTVSALLGSPFPSPFFFLSELGSNLQTHLSCMRDFGLSCNADAMQCWTSPALCTSSFWHMEYQFHSRAFLARKGSTISWAPFPPDVSGGLLGAVSDSVGCFPHLLLPWTLRCSAYRSISKLSLFILVFLKVKKMGTIIVIAINYNLFCIVLHNQKDHLMVWKWTESCSRDVKVHLQ